ncbi:hypothetical protein V1522DRAFT_410940 [Lipomyces starkeyi]
MDAHSNSEVLYSSAHIDEQENPYESTFADSVEAEKRIPSEVEQTSIYNGSDYFQVSSDTSSEILRSRVMSDAHGQDIVVAMPSEFPNRGVMPYSMLGSMVLRGKTIAQTWYDANVGLLLFAMGQLFSSSMNLFARILETTSDPPYNAMQIVFTRMSITTLACTFYIWIKGVPDAPLGPKEVRLLLVARGLTGFFGLFGMYYSLTYLSLSDATVISFLSPTVAGFACSIFINEKFGRVDKIAGFISFFGVILIAQPTPTLTAGDSTVTTGQRLGAVGVALLGVLGAAGAFTTIRCIGQRAHPLISVNYFAVICTIVSSCALTLSPSLHFVLPQAAWQWALLFSIGICGFCYQFLLTAGLQREKAGRAGNMLYLQMFLAFLFEKLVWNETPHWMEYAGSGIILGSAVWVAVSKRKTETGYDKISTTVTADDIESQPQRPTETYELSDMTANPITPIPPPVTVTNNPRP